MALVRVRALAVLAALVALGAGSSGDEATSEAVPETSWWPPSVDMRRKFIVLYNAIPARRHFSFQNSVTFCTHGHFHYFENLRPLLQRWEGPVSLAVHAPGDDMQRALDAIGWARACLPGQQVAERVSFHLFYERKHQPRPLPCVHSILEGQAPNCSAPPPWENVSAACTYRGQQRILYPINTARNIASESATTHWVLVTEIEMYPSLGLSSTFLEMVRRQPSLSQSPPRKVFALPTFEVEEGTAPPQTKTQLVDMINNGKARLFHNSSCFRCHNVPHLREWLSANASDSLHVFRVSKRAGEYANWEATFIGTRAEPPYDERLAWEGGSDRMIQAYILCALDYEYHVLDNGFLIHKPGRGAIITIKDQRRFKFVRKTNQLIHEIILPELKILYGNRTKCKV